MKNTTNSPKTAGRDFSQVQVLNRAALILRTVRDSGGLNLSQLARKVGLARTTTYRIVATLESEGLLTTSATGQIQPGIELVSLGAAVRTDLRRELRPYIEELSLRVDETVDLAILDRDHCLFLDQVTRLRRLHAVSGVGARFPLHCTANGKALLAALPPGEVERLLPETLPTYTPATITSRAALLRHLETVRAEGVAYDREEHTQGICAVGCVVPAPGAASAAISIPAPSVRFSGSAAALVNALLQTRRALQMRYRGL